MTRFIDQAKRPLLGAGLLLTLVAAGWLWWGHGRQPGDGGGVSAARSGRLDGRLAGATSAVARGSGSSAAVAPGWRLTGVVLEARTGLPLGGATIVVLSATALPPQASSLEVGEELEGMDPEDEDAAGETTVLERAAALAEHALTAPDDLAEEVQVLASGEEGAFSVEFLEAGAYLIAAVDLDHAAASVEVAVTGAEPIPSPRIELHRRHARIHGKIAFAGGPPPSTTLHLLGADGRMEPVEVAADGGFELAEVLPGSRTMLLRTTDAAGEPVEIARSLELAAGDDLELEFEDLASMVALRGTARGNVEPGDPVFLYHDAGGATLGRDARLKAGGAFSFAGIEPGSYVLVVGPVFSEILVAGDGDVQVEVFVPEVALRGRLLDSFGRAVPGARVEAARAGVALDATIARRLALVAKSDAEGLFVLEPADQALYDLEIRAPGFVLERRRVEASGADVLDFELEPAAE